MNTHEVFHGIWCRERFVLPAAASLAMFLTSCSTAPEPVTTSQITTTTHTTQTTVYEDTPAYTVKAAPPKARFERRTVAPSDQYVWVDGHWEYRNDDWRWVAGSWQLRPNEKTQWIPGQWVREGGGWNWVPGYWSDS